MQSTLTVEVKSFSDTLEKYIGFDLVQYKKAVDMLRQLKEGKLNSNFEQEFVAFITK